MRYSNYIGQMGDKFQIILILVDEQNLLMSKNVFLENYTEYFG